MGLKISDHFFDGDPKKLEKLEDEAKKMLKKNSEENKSTNAFISFAEEDLNEVNLLRGQAKNENTEMEFKDYSVKEPYDSTNADYLKRNIRERIKQTSVTIVYLSSNTSKSKWVNWEIEESMRLGKQVIGVYKGTTAPRALPRSITDNKIKVIKWTHAGIMNEIKK
jgi:hypothetical protein